MKEQELFEKYGVAKGMYCHYCDDMFNCFKKKCRHSLYPPITAEKVLRLIGFMNTLNKWGFRGIAFISGTTVEEIKMDVCKELIQLEKCYDLTEQERNEVKEILEG